jgi:hypothetical protein
VSAESSLLQALLTPSLAVNGTVHVFFHWFSNQLSSCHLEVAEAFRGKFHDRGSFRAFRKSLDRMLWCKANSSERNLCPLLLVLQSSGTGKSRLVDELAKERIMFQFNLRDSDQGEKFLCWLRKHVAHAFCSHRLSSTRH